MNVIDYSSGLAAIQPMSETAEIRAALSFVGWRSDGADLVPEAGTGALDMKLIEDESTSNSV